MTGYRHPDAGVQRRQRERRRQRARRVARLALIRQVHA